MATVRSRNFVVDTNLQLKASAAVTSSAAGSLILDLGDAFFRGAVVIDVSALDIASTDEFYTIILQGSPDSGFGTAGNIVELCAIHIGAKGPRLSDADKDSTTGRYILRFQNELNGATYRYLRLYTVVAGTTPTITYEAHVVKD